MVIEPSGPVRQMIAETLRELGFQKITGVSSPKDGLNAMQVDPVDWIITSLSANEGVNALHLLKTITLHPKLRHTRVTLLWEEANDDDVLSHAFELGLMSVHPKSYVRDSFIELFMQLFNLLESSRWDSTLVAADYLRAYLSRKGLHKERLSLEESLMMLYPGSSEILLHLADAELANKHQSKGCAILDQLQLIDESMAKNCRILRQKYGVTADQAESAASLPAKNIFDLSQVVVIDPDTDVIFHAKDLLSKAGVDDIKTFESGKTAFEWMSSSGTEPSLIVMEWKLPGITGAMLVQRIRSLGFYNVPIIVLSSMIKAADSPVLREMGVDECQEKPFDQSSFYRVIIRAIQQNRNPTEEKTLLHKIKRLLRTGKLHEADRLMKQLFQDERISEATRKEILAENHMAKGELEAARDAGIQAIKLGGNSLSMLNLVGKSMLKLRQFEHALKCFERANSISSLNVERLLNIAEACIEIDKVPEALQAVSQAKALDVSNSDVREMECKISIIDGKPEIARNLMGDLDSGKNIISFMNNRAVALVKSGRFDEGIVLYQKTMDSIPATWTDQQSSVLYNMGLAYARFGDLEKASGKLSGINKTNSSPSVFKRATSLLRRVKDSLAKKSALILAPIDDAASEVVIFSNAEKAQPSMGGVSTADPFENTAGSLELQRGEIGCHLIYSHSGQTPCKLLDNLPPFKERKAFDSSK